MRRPWWKDGKFWLDWRAWLVIVAVSIVPIALWIERPSGAETDILIYVIVVVCLGAIWLYWRDHRISAMRSERRTRRREERKRAVGFND